MSDEEQDNWEFRCLAISERYRGFSLSAPFSLEERIEILRRLLELRAAGKFPIFWADNFRLRVPLTTARLPFVDTEHFLRATRVMSWAEARAIVAAAGESTPERIAALIVAAKGRRPPSAAIEAQPQKRRPGHSFRG